MDEMRYQILIALFPSKTLFAFVLMECTKKDGMYEKNNKKTKGQKNKEIYEK